LFTQRCLKIKFYNSILKINTEYFVLLNYKTKEKYLCSWFEDEPDFYGQKINFIGTRNGLGGYNYMIGKGFIDRRFAKIEPIPYSTKIWDYYKKKWQQKMLKDV